MVLLAEEWHLVEEEAGKMFDKKIYPDILLNIVSIHGVYSDGEDLLNLCDLISGNTGIPTDKIKVSSIDYGTLLLTLERIPFVRNLIAMVVANRLAACSYKYPNAKTIVLAHSFGTYAIGEAIRKWYEEFRVNCLILFGSVINRKFDFSKYSDLEVYNFIGKKDFVVLSGLLWGTGASGIFGFKKEQSNVKQIKTNWGHGGYKESFPQLYGIISDFITRKL